MGILGDTFRAGANEVDRLETEHATLAAKVVERDRTIADRDALIDDLKRQLAEVGEPVPPPLPDWPTGGIILPVGADYSTIINNNPMGSTFRFAAGTHVFSKPLPLKGANSYIADDPTRVPKLVGGGPNGFPFASAIASGVKLKGLDISGFGPADSTEGGSMIHSYGGVDWLIEDCNIGDTNNGGIRWGSGWTLRRTRIHDCGRIAISGGGRAGVKRIVDCEAVHCGYVATDSNRGGCKFALTSNVEIDGWWVHDMNGNGIWFDIQNIGGKINNVTVEDCTRMGIFLEVSYGPFEVNSPTVRRCGSEKRSSEGSEWPVPGGILLSMTPDVTITNPMIEDCRNGVTAIQWAHPQIIGTVGSLDESRCGNENIIVNGGTVTRIAEYAAGLAGTRPAGTRLTRNVHWNGVTFDPGARFRSSLHI